MPYREDARVDIERLTARVAELEKRLQDRSDDHRDFQDRMTLAQARIAELEGALILADTILQRHQPFDKIEAGQMDRVHSVAVQFYKPEDQPRRAALRSKT